ncbi:MAG: hypothetical protein M0Z47_09315 [Actinomycetota bacterium]|nr:hypothetical protein [Actinomycetota bacterium]
MTAFSEPSGTVLDMARHSTQAAISFLTRIPKDLPRANAAAAEEVAVALSGLQAPELPQEAADAFKAIIAMADRVRPGVPVSVAARLLEVSEPTVRKWISRGVLEIRAGVRPIAISPRSLGEVLSKVRFLRETAAEEPRMLDYLMERQEWPDLPKLLSGIEAELTQLDPERIEEQLFG